MNVRSSIFNSDQRLPQLPWRRMHAVALLMLGGFVLSMELSLAGRGFEATVLDTEALWQKHRVRAGRLGKQALILVGASRIQLGLDPDVLRAASSLEPVQLAIDGSSFVPVLAGLAADPSITGTLLVSYKDHLIAGYEQIDRASAYQANYARLTRSALPDSTVSEALLASAVGKRLRSFADGARPLSTLLIRVLDSSATPQYLTTRHDRSRLADYSLVQMPDFYYARVLRSLGSNALHLPRNPTYDDIEFALRGEIGRLQPTSREAFERGMVHVESLVRKIQQRGGHVFFLVMPSSGFVRDIERKRYPRAQFWDHFARQTSAKTHHFEDYPALRDFHCPDGSHLDHRDREKFTEALTKIIKW